MTDKLTVTFHMLSIADGRTRAIVQFHDVHCVPDVGETCLVVTTRDGDGNYSSDGEPQRQWHGTVVQREFSYEIHGKDSASCHSAIYVDVYVDCAEATQ